MPRIAFQYPEDVHIFGYTAEERDRAFDFENDNFELNLAWPLIQAEMTKEDCHRMIAEAGIEQPAMYRLGFKNNNCIGCVKSSSPAYWNKIRILFPEKFKLIAERSRQIGCRLVKLNGVRIFLDELPADCFEDLKEDLSCGPQCKSNNYEK